MCKAFSGLVDFNDKVTWKLGVDSHADLAELGGYLDTQLGEFAKFEYTPKNGNYLNPDEWVFRWDEDVLPPWCGTKQKELALAAHKNWLKQLEKFINRHPVVHPFKLPPPSIERKHILLLKKWGSVWAYTGSFFKIPVWKYVKHPKGKYPFQPLVTLWNQGLVPSFDGTTWRLHGGPKAAVLFSISKAELGKYK